MRRLIRSKAIKSHFDIAWNVLPNDVQSILKLFIRHIREVESLEKTRIRCPDGTEHKDLEFGTGYTFFFKNTSIAFSDVILPTILNEFTEAEAVSLILHELAHAYEYATKHEEAIDNVDSEHEAWDQAIIWAKNSKLASEMVSEIEMFALEAKLRESISQFFKM
jgi:predicted SprT family Zn-dependent metalloprotease